MVNVATTKATTVGNTTIPQNLTSWRAARHAGIGASAAAGAAAAGTAAAGVNKLVHLKNRPTMVFEDMVLVPLHLLYVRCHILLYHYSNKPHDVTFDVMFDATTHM